MYVRTHFSHKAIAEIVRISVGTYVCGVNETNSEHVGTFPTGVAAAAVAGAGWPPPRKSERMKTHPCSGGSRSS